MAEQPQFSSPEWQKAVQEAMLAGLADEELSTR